MLTEDQIRELHGLWGELTGYALPLTLPRQDAWQAWARAVGLWIKHAGRPMTIRDALRAVVAYRRQQFRDKPNTLAAVLKFRHLVELPHLVEEDLAAWAAAKRAKTFAGDPARASVLRSTGRDSEAGGQREADAARPAAEAIERGFAMLREWRRDNP